MVVNFAGILAGQIWLKRLEKQLGGYNGRNYKILHKKRLEFLRRKYHIAGWIWDMFSNMFFGISVILTLVGLLFMTAVGSTLLFVFGVLAVMLSIPGYILSSGCKDNAKYNYNIEIQFIDRFHAYED